MGTRIPPTGMRKGLLGRSVEDHDRDRSRRLLLVVQKCRPYLAHELEQTVAFRPARQHPRSRRKTLSPGIGCDLDLDVRVRLNVAVPLGMVGSAAFGGDDNELVIALSPVNERGGDLIAALRASGRHQQHVVAPRPDAPALLGFELVDGFLVPGSSSHSYQDATKASRRAASSSNSRCMALDKGEKASVLTRPFTTRHEPATNPSTRKVCATSPLIPMTRFRYCSGSTLERSACASSTLSHFGRKRIGAGIDASGSRPR